MTSVVGYRCPVKIAIVWEVIIKQTPINEELNIQCILDIIKTND